MNCSQARDLLSRFHDGELAPAQRDTVSSHVQHCPDCTRALDDIRSLSELAARSPEPAPPCSLWHDLEQQLDGPAPLTRSATADVPRTASRRPALLAVLVLLAVGAGAIIVTTLRNPHGEAAHLAVSFDQYLKQFPANPDRAQQTLLAAYDNQTVSLQQAEQQVRYRPAVANPLPPGYRLESIHLIRMPCCHCVEAICRDADNRKLAIFEHAADQPIWFGHRPALTCRCNGRKTRLVQFEHNLAATWPTGKRFLTVVGVRDIDELTRLMEHLDP